MALLSLLPLSFHHSHFVKVLCRFKLTDSLPENICAFLDVLILLRTMYKCQAEHRTYRNASLLSRISTLIASCPVAIQSLQRKKPTECMKFFLKTRSRKVYERLSKKMGYYHRLHVRLSKKTWYYHSLQARLSKKMWHYHRCRRSSQHRLSRTCVTTNIV